MEARVRDFTCVIPDVGTGQNLFPFRLWDLVTGLGRFPMGKGCFPRGIRGLVMGKLQMGFRCQEIAVEGRRFP